MDRDNIMTLVVKIKEEEAKTEGKSVNHSSLLKRADLIITAMENGSSFFTPCCIDSRTDEELASLVADLMNRVRRIKECVINKLWVGNKQGDEYNNLSKIVENKINTLINGHFYFEFFLAEYRTDEEIAALIIPLIDLGAGNKKLLSEVEKSNGIRYNYSRLFLVDEEREETWAVLSKEIKEVVQERGVDPNNILKHGKIHADVLSLTTKKIHYCKPESYKKLLFTVMNMNNDLFEYLVKEVKFSRLIHRSEYGIDNLQKYAFLADSLFKSIYLFIILFEQDYCDSKLPLEKLIEELNKSQASIDESGKNADQILSVPLGKSYVNEMDEAVLSGCLIVYLDFKEYINECEIIANKLLKEPLPEPSVNPKLHSLIKNLNPEIIKSYLCGNKDVFNFEEKLASVRNLLKYASKQHNSFFDHRRTDTYIILFQELYIRKNPPSPYERCQAGKIVKELTEIKNNRNSTKNGKTRKATNLTGHQPGYETREEKAVKNEMLRKKDISRKVLLDEKFTRGFFYENNKMDMYPQFLEARLLYRKCILSILRIHDIGRAYCEFHALINKFLRFTICSLSKRIFEQEADYDDGRNYYRLLCTKYHVPPAKNVKYFFPYERHLF